MERLSFDYAPEQHMHCHEPSSTRMTELFTASLLSLYFELIVIRWLSSEIRIFAYFKNIPLMACLFGLGLGMALAGKTPRLSRWFPLGLTIIVAVISLLSAPSGPCGLPQPPGALLAGRIPERPDGTGHDLG